MKPAASNWDTLVISTADWDAPLWTNKQNVATILAQAGRVTYWNSIGLRRPRISLEDMRRVKSRIAKVVHRSRRRPDVENLTVRDPKCLPYHRFQPARVLNRFALTRQSKPWRQTRTRKLLWTYSPETYSLERFADRVVYHCVDHLSAIDGVSPDLIAASERRLANLSTITAIGSSQSVVKHLKEVGFNDVRYWPNVAHFKLFHELAKPSSQRQRTAVFAGNITQGKVNAEILWQIAGCSQLTLHIAGPTGIDGTPIDRAVSELLNHENVVYHGTLTQGELAELLGTASVGLIPYLNNEYNVGVFPMKVYEYLGAGLGVVATGLPSIEGIDHVSVVADSEAAVKKTKELLQISDLQIQQRQDIARMNSWDQRQEQIFDLLSEEI